MERGIEGKKDEKREGLREDEEIEVRQ